MQSTGIVRHIDDLGRIVLPKELRKMLNINPKDPFEILVHNGDVILRKYDATCVFCGSQDDLVEFEEKSVCGECFKKINKICELNE